MAKLTVVPPEEPRYLLELSKDEARALLEVCWHIGGHEERSARRFFSGRDGDKNTIKGALEAAGVRRPRDCADGSIRF